jgi:hypothetical protein
MQKKYQRKKIQTIQNKIDLAEETKKSVEAMGPPPPVLQATMQPHQFLQRPLGSLISLAIQPSCIFEIIQQAVSPIVGPLSAHHDVEPSFHVPVSTNDGTTSSRFKSRWVPTHG